MNPITHMGRRPATQLACFFEHNDLPTRARDQRGREKSGQSAPHDDHICVFGIT